LPGAEPPPCDVKGLRISGSRLMARVMLSLPETIPLGAGVTAGCGSRVGIGVGLASDGGVAVG
jgi:hypothetical protein